jgi:23S rRNA (adenine2503-C2)-methyltransferase
VKSAPTDLYDLTRGELFALFGKWGFSPVHAARLWKYLYLGLAGSLDDLVGLPARVRAQLAAETRLGGPPIHPEIPPRPP